MMDWHQPYCQPPRHITDGPLAERCICGQTRVPPSAHPTDPFAILDAIVAELVGPAWVGKARQLELGALLADVRVRLEGP